MSADQQELLETNLRAHKKKAQAFAAASPADLPEALARTARLIEALKAITKLKSQPIGGTGFSTGPLALLKQTQRIAREALREHAAQLKQER